MSGADVAESTTAPAPLNPTIIDSATGHERSGFVQPRTYLEPAEPITPTKPLSPIDREQIEGLVSGLMDLVEALGLS